MQKIPAASDATGITEFTRTGGKSGWSSKAELQQQFLPATESAFGNAFEFFHELAEVVVGGVALRGASCGVAFLLFVIGGSGSESLELGDVGIEYGDGVTALGEFGGLRVFLPGFIGSLGQRDESAGVFRDVAGDAEGDPIGLGPFGLIAQK
jgi:hypothetical protein